jgi:hypothetical protein
MACAQENHATLRHWRTGCSTVIGLLLLWAAPTCMAQDPEADSVAIYKKLHIYSEKHKVARWIYEGIFVAPSAVDEEQAPAKKAPKRVDPFRKYKGKIIRHIDVHVNDPFGYSVDDTTYAPTSRLQRIGNGLHLKTHERVIRGLLLMREGEQADPLKLTESERLLRASPVVNAARIMVRRVKTASDSVDVVVFVVDKWSIDAVGDISTSDGSITLRDRNLLGFGQRFEQGIGYSLGDQRPDLSGQYVVYNIGRSYIGTSVFYATSAGQDQAGVELHRDFFSPLTKWAGGAALISTWTHPITTDSTGAEIGLPRTRPVNVDTWLGRSFPLLNDTAFASRLSRVIVGVRYAQTRFTKRPSFELDTLRTNSNTSLFLVGAGISQQQFYKDRYLFRFGLTEDVPEGLLFRVNTGVRKRELVSPEPYVGAEVTRGRNYDGFGYLTATVAYGTFFQRGRAEDGALRLDVDYFTDDLLFVRWHLRQFVKLSSTVGFNRASDDRLTLNGQQLYGFSSEVVSGTRKTTLGFQTVLYAPFSLLGFRFAPVALLGLGTVDEEGDPWFSNRIYPAFAIGLLVRNEYLLVKTFEVSIGFYPDVPGSSNATTVFNPISGFDLGARGYAFSRPDEVGYY